MNNHLVSVYAFFCSLLSLPGAEAAESRRVVALGGAVTEWVHVLGHGASLVGVDDSSSFPPAVAALPKVGYYRMLSAEGVLSLRPDLVLASEEAGPPAALAAVEAAGVRVIRVPAEKTVAGALAMGKAVAAALGSSTEAPFVPLEAMAKPKAAESAPKILFLMVRGGAGAAGAGQATAADEMIRLAGGRNALQGFQGYRPVSAEALVLAQPEWVLVGQETLAAMGGEQAVWRIPGLAATPAGKARRLLAMEELLLLGFGPRLPEAVHTLQTAIRDVP